jgi:hypothetical protein
MRTPDAMGELPGELVKIIDGILFSKGDKVRLKLGKKRSDAADMFLDDKIATIEIIYTDYDDNVHIAVTMDDDPGQELQRELGIYRFFSPDEVELL